MNPELQVIVDRLEMVERRNRNLWLLAAGATALAVAALAAPFLTPAEPRDDRARYSVVEANRFLLRGLDGSIAGGLETSPAGDIKLVLGSGRTAAAFLEVQSNGVAHLTLRDGEGRVRAAMIGGRTPSVTLSAEGRQSSAALSTLPDGAGTLLINDARGRVRYRIP